MPGEDGYAFIRRVREWERASGVRIPAVALTAYARSEDRIRALLAGYQVHVAKPIEPVEFALVVAGAIQSKPSGP
jgi:CheY-like chemotaxis protein